MRLQWRFDERIDSGATPVCSVPTPQLARLNWQADAPHHSVVKSLPKEAEKSQQLASSFPHLVLQTQPDFHFFAVSSTFASTVGVVRKLCSAHLSPTLYQMRATTAQQTTEAAVCRMCRPLLCFYHAASGELPLGPLPAEPPSGASRGLQTWLPLSQKSCFCKKTTTATKLRSRCGETLEPLSLQGLSAVACSAARSRTRVSVRLLCPLTANAAAGIRSQTHVVKRCS